MALSFHLSVPSVKVGHSLTTRVWNGGLFLWAQWKVYLVTKVCCCADYANIPQPAGACTHTHTHAFTWLMYDVMHDRCLRGYSGTCVGAFVCVCVWVRSLSCLRCLHITVWSLECITRQGNWETASTKRSRWCHTVITKENVVQYLRHSAQGQQQVEAGSRLVNI